MFGALNRADGAIEFVQARHEEMAAFMASAYAKFSGELGIWIATSGPSATHPACAPDDLIDSWFAPCTGMNPPSDLALGAAETYGLRLECKFNDYPERREGVFWKWVPAI